MRFSQLSGKQRDKMHNAWHATYQSPVAVYPLIHRDELGLAVNGANFPAFIRSEINSLGILKLEDCSTSHKAALARNSNIAPRASSMNYDWSMVSKGNY